MPQSKRFMSVTLYVPADLLKRATCYAGDERLPIEDYIVLAIAEKVARTEHDKWLARSMSDDE